MVPTVLSILVLTTAIPPSDEEILAKADARIQEHRTREVSLKLLDAEGRPIPGGTKISIEQTAHEFLFGCNIYALGRLQSDEDNEAYIQRFSEIFNFATLPFYWWSYERQRGRPDYARTEEILETCRDHGITAKGHPLAWNYVDPPWIPEAPGEAMDLQVARVAECARRFHDKIMIWDVVNEAAHYDRDHVRKQAPRLTHAIDEVGVGEYVRRAFRAARKASPGAVLLINDYRLDDTYEKRVLAELVDGDGKPLYDVIGLQSHQHGGARPLAQLWDICEKFARYGRPLHWTENTFVSGEEGWDLPKKRPGFQWETTPEGEERQARRTARFYKVLFSHPAVEAITWWDFSDQRAWQRAPAGLLRTDMSPKPAYERLKKLIKSEWWTRTTTQADEKGLVKFRGFCGRYRVRTSGTDPELEGEFALERKGEAPLMRLQLGGATGAAAR